MDSDLDLYVPTCGRFSRALSDIPQPLDAGTVRFGRAAANSHFQGFASIRAASSSRIVSFNRCRPISSSGVQSSYS